MSECGCVAGARLCRVRRDQPQQLDNEFTAKDLPLGPRQQVLPVPYATTSGMALTLSGYGIERLVTKLNGNVGIGIQDPGTYRLNVQKEEDVSAGMHLSARVENLTIGYASDGNQRTASIVTTGEGLPLALGSSGQAGGIEHGLTISPAGNVGIHTAMPTYPLDVAGTARVQKDLEVAGSVKATAFVGDGTALTGVLHETSLQKNVSRFFSANDTINTWTTVFPINSPGVLTGISLKSRLFNSGGDSHAEFTLRITVDGVQHTISDVNIPRGSFQTWHIVNAAWTNTDPPTLDRLFDKAPAMGTAADLNVPFRNSLVIELRANSATDGRNGFMVATTYRK